jgi:nitrogenase molybdenum-iron protein alpha/beta subunit
MAWQERFNEIIIEVKDKTTGAIDVRKFLDRATVEVGADPDLRIAYIAWLTKEAAIDAESETAVKLLATLQELDLEPVC